MKEVSKFSIVICGAKNVFNVFLELHKCLFGMGCKAQCAVHSPAMDKRCNAADRPKRHLPEGLE